MESTAPKSRDSTAIAQMASVTKARALCSEKQDDPLSLDWSRTSSRRQAVPEERSAQQLIAGFQPGFII